MRPDPLSIDGAQAEARRLARPTTRQRKAKERSRARVLATGPTANIGTAEEPKLVLANRRERRKVAAGLRREGQDITAASMRQGDGT